MDRRTILQDNTEVNGTILAYELLASEQHVTNSHLDKVYVNDLVADTVTANNYITSNKPTIKVTDNSTGNTHKEITVEMIDSHAWALINLQLIPDNTDVYFNDTEIIADGKFIRKLPTRMHADNIIRVLLEEDTHIHSWRQYYDIMVEDVPVSNFTNIMFNRSPSKYINEYPSINYVLVPNKASANIQTQLLPLAKPIATSMHTRILSVYGSHMLVEVTGEHAPVIKHIKLARSDLKFDNAIMLMDKCVITRRHFNNVDASGMIIDIETGESAFDKATIMKAVNNTEHAFDILDAHENGDGYWFIVKTDKGTVMNTYTKSTNTIASLYYDGVDVLGRINNTIAYRNRGSYKLYVNDIGSSDPPTELVGDYSNYTGISTDNCIMIAKDRNAFSNTTCIFSKQKYYAEGGIYYMHDAIISGETIKFIDGFGNFAIARPTEAGDYGEYMFGVICHDIVSATITSANTASVVLPTCTLTIDMNTRVNTVITDQLGHTSALANTNVANSLSALNARYL